jgi:hypothetical protein
MGRGGAQAVALSAAATGSALTMADSDWLVAAETHFAFSPPVRTQSEQH